MKNSNKYKKSEILCKKAGFALFISVISFLLGCVEEITPEREVRERGSFGTELYNIVYDNSVHSEAHHSELFLSTLQSNREKFIDAVDTTAVPEELEALNDVFVEVVPLYENMLYPTTLRKIGTVVGEVKENPTAVDGFAWILKSPNMQYSMPDANLMGLMFNYEGLPEITDELLDLAIKNTTAERNATNQMLKELSIVSADLQPSNDSGRFVRRAIDMLLKPDAAYAPQTSYEPQIVAALDDRGHAKIKLFKDGKIYAPFVDSDKDGYADTDALGYYISNTGLRISPFETEDKDGFVTAAHQVYYEDKPVFETFDIQQTPLAYLLREGDAMLQNNTLDEALRATQTLLGEPRIYTDEHGTYTGYDKHSGVVQLLAAVLTTLDHDSVGPNFEASIQLLHKHQDVVARLIHDLDIIFDIIDETPSNFSADNNLVDRLLPELLKIAEEPGLLDELLIALDDPRAAHIAPILSELASVKKQFISVEKDGKYDKCFQTCDSRFDVGTLDRMNCIRKCPIDEVIGHTKARHDLPETLENRSLMQRITHLIWETAGTKYDVKTEKLIVKDADLTLLANEMLGTLLSFDNLAEAYLLTYTGDLHLVDYISPTFIQLAGYINSDASSVAELLTLLTQNMFDLKLSVNPTTAEVTRMFNMAVISSQGDWYRFDLTPADCRSGFKCLQSNADTLYAIEATGLVDALYPVVEVFNKHGKTAIFAKIVSIIFEYYTTGNVKYVDITGEPLELYPSDFRSLEPVLIRALDETNVVSDVGALCDALLNVELSDGTRLTQRFEKFVAYILTPDPNLKTVKDENFVMDPMGNRVSPISPAYLYVDAIRDISDHLDGNEEIKDQFKNAVSGFEAITVKTIRKEDGTVVFEKPAGINILASILELLHTMYLEKTERNIRHRWIHDEAIPSMTDVLSGRLLYAYFQLFNDLDADPEGLEKFRKLVLHLMESGHESPRRLVGTVYQLMVWLMEQNHFYALVRALSDPIDPDRAWHTGNYDDKSLVTTILLTVHAFNQADPEHAFNRVVYRLFETDTRSRPNLLRLLDIAGELFRVEVGSKKLMTAADQKGILDFAYDLFMDDDRGVERIYGILDFTIWGTAGRPDNWADNVSYPIE